jgi:hypothetical protein
MKQSERRVRREHVRDGGRKKKKETNGENMRCEFE